MAKSKQEIIDAIDAYISKGGGGYSVWYVGISSDAKDRLFTEHRVRVKGDLWICDQASSSQEAREIEDYFVNTLGTEGATGGGDYTTDMVYAYKKAPHTDP